MVLAAITSQTINRKNKRQKPWNFILISMFGIQTLRQMMKYTQMYLRTEEQQHKLWRNKFPVIMDFPKALFVGINHFSELGCKVVGKEEGEASKNKKTMKRTLFNWLPQWLELSTVLYKLHPSNLYSICFNSIPGCSTCHGKVPFGCVCVCLPYALAGLMKPIMLRQCLLSLVVNSFYICFG